MRRNVYASISWTAIASTLTHVHSLKMCNKTKKNNAATVSLAETVLFFLLRTMFAPGGEIEHASVRDVAVECVAINCMQNLLPVSEAVLSSLTLSAHLLDLGESMPS